MSRFIELYQERQAVKRNLKKIRRKASPEEYWKLKAEEKGLTERSGAVEQISHPRRRNVKNSLMIIAIDFDGTCVTHEFPNEGSSIGAEKVLKKLIKGEHQLILYTMRSGASLETAIQWFLKNDISLYGIQFNPEQARWTSSNKCYAQLYIDDAALGCPLVYGRHERPFVDWVAVEAYLYEKGILKPTIKMCNCLTHVCMDGNGVEKICKQSNKICK